MSKWQRVEWDEEGHVSSPEWLVNQGALWPVLVRFETQSHIPGEPNYINKTVSNRMSLTEEEENYVSIMVAPVIWPEEE